MRDNGLTEFIISYIATRRQTKLEAFDKDSAKRVGAASEAERASLHVEQAQARRELELRYETRAWLTDAASRAGQISLVTHAAKFTHGDSRSSSVLSETSEREGYLSTSTLAKPAADAVGNAAALDIAKLLQTDVDGDSLLACLQRGDASPLAELAENEAQLKQWMAGFANALGTRQPSSHKLAKQIYFPAGEGYHLLSPLFSSSLAHALHQKIVALRFGEQNKAIWQARRDKRWHPSPLVMFPNTAVMNFGGTKPQNISALNSARGGRVWLLPCAAPQWEAQDKPPLGSKTVFGPGPFERNTVSNRRRLADLLIKCDKTNNVHIRRARERYVDEIIDVLFSLAADIQREVWQGWTQDQKEKCMLKPHQQLWLDPWRVQSDDLFRGEREKDEWQDAVADDFARWLNSHLMRAGLPVGKPEHVEWQQLFKRRLQGLEQVLRSYRHA